MPKLNLIFAVLFVTISFWLLNFICRENFPQGEFSGTFFHAMYLSGAFSTGEFLVERVEVPQREQTFFKG